MYKKGKRLLGHVKKCHPYFPEARFIINHFFIVFCGVDSLLERLFVRSTPGFVELRQNVSTTPQFLPA